VNAYRPQLATLVKSPPRGPGWVHEIKFDGYRIGGLLRGGEVTLISRNGKDWTAQFPEVARAVAALPAREALLDGEVCLVLPDGRTSFQALQNVFGGGPRSGLVYFAFDLTWLDGVDLGRRPLLERKAALAGLLEKAGGDLIRPSAHWEEDGEAVWREACRLRLEGIVSKRADAAYRPGRNADWVKVKCIQRQELVIGGFTDPEGAARTGLGALLVGYREGDRLAFAGKVGTGFTNASAAALRRKLDALEVKECPFSPRPAGPLGKNAHWVRPELVAEVAFTEWTDDGKVRHPSFQGLREDKDAPQVVKEDPAPAPGPEPAPAPARAAAPAATAARTALAAPARAAATTPKHPKRAAAPAPKRPRRAAAAKTTPVPSRRASAARADAAPVVCGIRISHPDRVLYPDAGITKLDLARYYERVASAILPHLRGRPLTLVHCPTGIGGDCRYMKHSKVWARGPVRRISIREKTKVGEYLVVDDEAALLSMAQMNILELHTWNTRAEHLEQPDQIVLDLDPGPEVPWRDVVGAARDVRDALREAGLESWVKTTGGAGLHVVAPVVPKRDWSECLEFSRAFAQVLAKRDPRRFTVAYARAGRERLILLDYLRNNRTNTSVAAYSTRARAGAPVSTPIHWDELTARLRPAKFTVKTVPRRLRTLADDPWKGYWTSKQRLPK
jgi:bifunctional non-homologous end joining protein LigD